MTLEKYYYSPERLNCKNNHVHYSECPDESYCPYAFCERCDVDYMALDELGEFLHNVKFE